MPDSRVLKNALLPPGPGNTRNSEGAFVGLAEGRILFAYSHFTGGDGDDTLMGGAGLDRLGLSSAPSRWRQNLMACSGIEYCKLSFAETRVRAQGLVPDLEERLADLNSALDVPVTVNLNGCPNSCARIQIADIGFKGQMIDDGDGPVEGFQVHLGGSLGLDSGFGRKLRQHKVLSDELGEYIERVVRNFVKQREDGERFAQWAVRADEADLR